MDELSNNGQKLRSFHLLLLIVPIFLLSLVSFLALDQFPWFIMMELGFNFGTILVFIIRAVFADRLTGLFTGFLGLSRSKSNGRSLVLAALLFGTPIFTLYFISGNSPPFLSPFVSLAWFTIRGALIYEFPRLTTFVLVKKYL